MRVIKYRGRRFRGGFHDFTIRTGGLEIYPRLVSSEHKTEFERHLQRLGGLDAILGGGVERGSSCLILGPAGTGKSLVALYFILSAIQRGEKAALFAFDEELGLLFDRTLAFGIDLEAMARGNLLDPAGRRRRAVARRIHRAVRNASKSRASRPS